MFLFVKKYLKNHSHAAGGYFDLSKHAEPTTEKSFDDTQIFDRHFIDELNAKGMLQ